MRQQRVIFADQVMMFCNLPGSFSQESLNVMKSKHIAALQTFRQLLVEEASTEMLAENMV